MVAEPLEKGLGEDIERGVIMWPGATNTENVWTERQLTQVLESKYNWDALAARSVWAFGPDTQVLFRVFISFNSIALCVSASTLRDRIS